MESQDLQFEAAVQFAANLLANWEHEYITDAQEESVYNRCVLISKHCLLNETGWHVRSWVKRSEKAEREAGLDVGDGVRFYIGPDSSDNTWIVMSRDSTKWPLRDLDDPKNVALKEVLVGGLVFQHKNLFYAKFRSQAEAQVLANMSV